VTATVMEPFTKLTSRCVVLPASNVDTDQIIPARFLKTVSRRGLGEHLFADWRLDQDGSPRADFALNSPAAKGASILVAGDNFGCGSSREHAVWALHQFGFRAVVAPSFSDIFYGNCTKNGLLPVILDEAECAALADAGEGRIDVDDQTVNCAGGVFRFDIDEEVKRRVIGGLDDIAVTLMQGDAIDAFERSGGADRGPVTTDLTGS
jgi:3-isopropylmalate/(R)-2-methylmalate dehydratase small subunit